MVAADDERLIATTDIYQRRQGERRITIHAHIDGVYQFRALPAVEYGQQGGLLDRRFELTDIGEDGDPRLAGHHEGRNLQRTDRNAVRQIATVAIDDVSERRAAPACCAVFVPCEIRDHLLQQIEKEIPA